MLKWKWSWSKTWSHHGFELNRISCESKTYGIMSVVDPFRTIKHHRMTCFKVSFIRIGLIKFVWVLWITVRAWHPLIGVSEWHSPLFGDVRELFHFSLEKGFVPGRSILWSARTFWETSLMTPPVRSRLTTFLLAGTQKEPGFLGRVGDLNEHERYWQEPVDSVQVSRQSVLTWRWAYLWVFVWFPRKLETFLGTCRRALCP